MQDEGFSLPRIYAFCATLVSDVLTGPTDVEDLYLFAREDVLTSEPEWTLRENGREMVGITRITLHSRRHFWDVPAGGIAETAVSLDSRPFFHGKSECICHP